MPKPVRRFGLGVSEPGDLEGGSWTFDLHLAALLTPVEFDRFGLCTAAANCAASGSCACT